MKNTLLKNIKLKMYAVFKYLRKNNKNIIYVYNLNIMID